MTSNVDFESLHYEKLLAHNRQQAALHTSSINIQRIGIIGAGLMGSSIASNCVRFGKEVRLLDADHEVAAQAVRRIRSETSNASVDQVLSYDQLNGLDLVIESVVETIEVKKLVLRKISESIDNSTIVATNTSAIPLSRMLPFVRDPERFCGIHFCHPELMSLVEVVRSVQTSDQTFGSAIQFVTGLNKLPVGVNDCAGFVVNRLLAAMIDQSLRLLMSGVKLDRIDSAMREFGFEGGPFEIMDVIGIDTCMYAGRTMWEAGLECVSLSPILPKLVKKSRLGRKTNLGFYRYDSLRGPAVPDSDLDPLIAGYVDESSTEFSSDLIRNQILAAIVREARLILDAQIVGSPHDIDQCIIDGFSFPKQQGGILFWADRFGLKTIVHTLEKIAIDESKMAPPATLTQMASEGNTFYRN